MSPASILGVAISAVPKLYTIFIVDLIKLWWTHILYFVNTLIFKDTLRLSNIINHKTQKIVQTPANWDKKRGSQLNDPLFYVYISSEIGLKNHKQSDKEPFSDQKWAIFLMNKAAQEFLSEAYFLYVEGENSRRTPLVRKRAIYDRKLFSRTYWSHKNDISYSLPQSWRFVRIPGIFLP